MHQALHAFPGGLSEQHGGQVRTTGSTSSPKGGGLPAGRQGRGIYEARNDKFGCGGGVGPD